MKKNLLLVFALALFISSCSDDEDEQKTFVEYSLESEVVYTRIDSLSYINSNGKLKMVYEPTLPWERFVEINGTPKLEFNVYGEAANESSNQWLNSIYLRMKGSVEDPNNYSGVNEALNLQPLGDTLVLNHSLTTQ